MAHADEDPTRLTRSLSARLRRKEKVARGEAVPDLPEDVVPPDPAGDVETDEEAALSDDELLAKYGVEDPEAIEDESKLDTLLQGQFPDRIRQMALRRMWRLNPLFRFADEMVEYGENYTDAATVIDGMQTAYQVGKGYLQQAFDAVDDDTGNAAAPAAGPQKTGGAAADTAEAESARPDATSDTDPSSQDEGDAVPDPAATDGNDGEVTTQEAADGEPDYAVTKAVAPGNSGADTEGTPPPPRPRRMTFHRPE